MAQQRFSSFLGLLSVWGCLGPVTAVPVSLICAGRPVAKRIAPVASHSSYTHVLCNPKFIPVDYYFLGPVGSYCLAIGQGNCE